MLDIAPDYAGIVFSVSNTISNIPGFIVPAVVGSLLTDYTDTNQWFYVFSLGLEYLKLVFIGKNILLLGAESR